MSRFIKVTSPMSPSVYINIDTISSVHQSCALGDDTRIIQTTVSADNFWSVMETIEQIMELISEAK
jgi:hypothetical protein